MEYNNQVFAMFGGREKYEGAIEKLVAFSDVQPNENVLELCCGTGISTTYVLQKTKEVTAVELNRKRMEYARQNLPREVRFITANAGDLKPEQHGTYDKVFCINGFHYFQPEETFYKIAKRMLKKNGRLIFNVKLRDLKGIKPLAEEAGKATGRAFTDILIRTGTQHQNRKDFPYEIKDTAFIDSEVTEANFMIHPFFTTIKKEPHAVRYDTFESKKIFYDYWCKQLMDCLQGRVIHQSVIDEAVEKYVFPVIFEGSLETKLAKAELFVEAEKNVEMF